MTWWRASVAVPTELAEAAAFLVAQATDVPTEVQDAGTLIGGDDAHTARLVLAFDAAPPADLPEQIAGCLRQLGILAPGEAAPVATRRHDDDSWRDGWRAFFHAQQLSERVWVRPPWEAAPEDAECVVVIDPGMAFGTGTHETTRGVMRALDPLLAGAPTRVLDVGCGSAILSIAAARLGHHAVGVEIDPVALVNAAENVARNGVGPRVELVEGSADAVSDRFPLVVANIIAPILCEIAPQIAARASDLLVLSGLLVTQEAQVRAAYPEFAVESRTTEGEWVVLVTRRR